MGLAVTNREPSLRSITLNLHPDGRILTAHSPMATGPVAPHLAETLSLSIEAVSRCSGAPERALWAIATDSLANQILWSSHTPTDAERLATSIGPVLPVPRYMNVSGRLVVRRASCCLIYQSPGTDKCVSCPRQTPDERLSRLSSSW
jgi:hypothetical protein